MSIIDFRPEIEDFISLSFPEIAIAWVKNPEQQMELFINQQLRDFDDVQSFVKTQIESKRVKFIKVDPANEPQNGYCAHYVCFGGDPDSLEDSISFRIDQSWDSFKFPRSFNESVINGLKPIVGGLSGAIIGRLDFPEIVLSKEWLGNPRVCYGYDGKGNIVNSESIQRAITDYFLVAKDYWGVATILDKSGFIWLWNTMNQKNFELRQTGLSLKEWFQTELENPFRQRPEPEWIQHKNA